MVLHNPENANALVFACARLRRRLLRSPGT